MAVMNRRTEWGLAIATGSAALLFAAACGSDGGSDEGTADGANGFTAYIDCLKGQGIDVSGMPTARASGQPGGNASGRPTAFPSGRPSGAPSGGPGGPGGGMGGPGGGFRPDGVDDATWQKAQEACQSAMPTGGPGGAGRNGQADTAFRNCLSDRGVELNADTKTTDPTVAAALEACEVLRPTPTATP